MDSCNPSKCAKVWPSTTAMSHRRRLPSQEDSALEVEGINSRLNTMSMEARSQGLHDLHGVSGMPDENPEMLNTKIAEMNDALSSPGDSAATLSYRTALDMDAAYVESLKIPCLRATIYNSQDAASLMMRFFDHKLNLFGAEKLVRDIRLSDLDRPGEMEALREKGLAQILPHRDRSGRVVFLNVGRVNQQYDIEVVLRVTFYVTMQACFQHDDETQKKGFIFLYFGFRQSKNLKLSRAIRYHKLAQSLPIKIAALHVCRHDDSDGNVLKVVLQYVTGFMEQTRLCRWRTHVGTQMEVMYSLMTFGILKEALPLADDGELDLTNHHRMLDSLQRKEGERAREAANTVKVPAVGIQLDGEDEDDRDGKNRSNKKSTYLFVAVPGPMDILMGRGRHPTSMPGAETLRNVIIGYREKYDASTKFEKQVITALVLKQVKELGCRFLRETAGGYEECGDDVARSKISHGFRNERIRTRIKQQQQKQRGEDEKWDMSNARKRRIDR